MLRRHNRLFLLLLVISSIALYWGCSQPDSIVTDKSETVISLEAERLPTTPVGMLYKLWVADALIDDSIQGAVPIAEFTYDFTTDTYMDENWVAREESNRFVMQGDIFDYRWLFISVQRADHTGPEVGSVMLIDAVTDPSYNDLNLIFPLSDSLAFSAVEFNMETSSDGRYPATDGSGVWFSVYEEREGSVQDTLALTRWNVEITYKDSFKDDQDSCQTFITEIHSIDTMTIRKVFGFDTLDQVIVTFEMETVTECDSGQGYLFSTQLNLSYQTGVLIELIYDDFIQVAVALPDYRSYGWQYKGWVVSSIIKDQGVSLGDITPPAWIAYNTQDSLLRGIDGGLLSSGTFSNLDNADDINLYVDNPYRVPNIPGEDFLKNLPGGRDVAVNLVPGDGIKGTVFITLEPINRYSDTTNFPLFAMTRDLPATRAEVEATEQQFTMWNRTNNNRDVLVGFPRVHVEIERH